LRAGGLRWPDCPIRARHPALLNQLRDAGCREFGFTEMTPLALRPLYEPEAGDDEMVILTSRRTTFELVLRRYAEALPGVTIAPNTFVHAITVEAGDGAPRVAGASIERDGKTETWPADVVIDAQGRLSACPEQLREAGAHVGEEAEDCGIVYFTRHYRRTAADPPPARATATGDLAQNDPDRKMYVEILDRTTGAAPAGYTTTNAGPLNVAVLGSRYQDFRAYPDGSVAYPAPGSNATTINILRILGCGG